MATADPTGASAPDGDEVILEGVVTTTSPDGATNIAPMGPRVPRDMSRLVLRPFRTSTTYANLSAHPEGVLHVTDDVELIAHAAVGAPDAPLERARVIAGWRLRDACRAYEFRVVDVDDREPRATFTAEIVHVERIRDFFGFSRARHAVLEAAILATRVGIMAGNEIEAEMSRLTVLIDKTGGRVERRAFEFLRRSIRDRSRSSRDSSARE